ncbi:MAG: hypothetical protein CL868_06760 [Cytophagaceae bacterium]|nr:hypothetical protein [Cytophagaceae bacterium]|tara:strand:- start:29643 stop:30077 length:435 start_codon:yes stop_codon:yes gene_type:complete
MAFGKVTDKLDALSDDVKSYLDSTVEYYKLFIFKKGVKSIIKVTNMVIMGVIFLIILAFLSIGLAIVIGDAMDSDSVGFFIVAGIYLIVLIIFMVAGRPFIQQKILKGTSRSFFKMNEELPSAQKRREHLHKIQQRTETDDEIL